jgi:hypothetical protein
MQPRAIKRVIVGGEPIVEEGTLVTVDARQVAARVGEVTKGWERP